MPPRTANVTDEVYNDIQNEMEKTNRSYSFVVNRRLEKLMEIEKEKMDG
jgi:predicted CopG family antitoxin